MNLLKYVNKKMMAWGLTASMMLAMLPGQMLQVSAACSSHTPNQDAGGSVIYYITEEDHYHICSTCYEVYATAPHSDSDVNSECDVCEVSLDQGRKTHSHVLTGQYGHKDQYGHTLYCSDVKCIGMFETHTNMNGVDSNGDGTADCDDCGWAGLIVGAGTTSCDHSANHWWDVSDNTHEEFCQSCGTSVGIPGNHENIAGSDDKCDVCGVSVNGQNVHEHTWSNTWSEDGTKREHFKNCTDLVCMATTANGKHHDGNSDNVCDTCSAAMAGGGTTCTHVKRINGDGTEQIIPGESQHFNICDNCNTEFNGQAHDNADDGTRCSQCHAPVADDGNGNYIHNHHMDPKGLYIDAYIHYERCDSCGLTLNDTPHEDKVDNLSQAPAADGMCDTCGTTVVLENSNQYVHYCGNSNPVAQDTFDHAEECPNCDQKNNWANHYDGNADGKCDDCQATVDANHEHIHQPDGNWFDMGGNHTCECTECYEWPEEDHGDDDNDGQCDGCNAAMGGNSGGLGGNCTHSQAYNWDTMESTHIKHCADCGEIVAPVAGHRDGNADGKCDDCGVGVDQENLHAHVWSNVWKPYPHAHGHQCTDNRCSQSIDYIAHVDDDGNNFCDECMEPKSPEWCSGHVHDGTYEPFGTLHYQKCGNCTTMFGTGLAHVADPFDWERDEDKHYEVCTDCRVSYGNGYAHVDQDKNQMCDVCGVEGLNSSNVHSHKFTWNADVTEHVKSCDCGSQFLRGFHVDDNGDGNCEFCGAAVTLNTTEYTYEHHHTLDKYTVEQYAHIAYCAGCGSDVYWEAHIDMDVNDICDVCNAAIATVSANLSAATHSDLLKRFESALKDALDNGNYQGLEVFFGINEATDFVNYYGQVTSQDPSAVLDIIVRSEAVFGTDLANDPDSKEFYDKIKEVAGTSAIVDKLFLMQINVILADKNGDSNEMTLDRLNDKESFDFELKLNPDAVKTSRVWYVYASKDEGETYQKIAATEKGASTIAFSYERFFDMFVLAYEDVSQGTASGNGTGSNESSKQEDTSDKEGSGSTLVETIPAPQTGTTNSANTQTQTQTQTPAQNATPESADTSIMGAVASEEVVAAAKETVTVSEGTAIVDTDAVEAIVEATAEDAPIVIPAAQISEETVEKVEISLEAMESIVESEKDVVIELTDITLKLDAKALENIALQADGAKIEIRAIKTGEEQLSDSQKKGLGKKEVAMVVTAQIFSDGKYIGNFRGGKVTVKVPFQPEEGRNGKDYVVYFVGNDGKIEKIPNAYEDRYMIFTTGHFSDYVIAYEAAETEAEAETVTDSSDEEVEVKEETGIEEVEKASVPVVPIVIAVIILAVVTAVVLMKKKRVEE